MGFYDYFVIIFGIIAVLAVLIFAVKTKAFFKTMITSAALGLAVLIALNLTSELTGLRVEITPFTLGASSIFGLPGVICVVVSKMIFGL